MVYLAILLEASSVYVVLKRLFDPQKRQDDEDFLDQEIKLNAKIARKERII